VAQLRHSLHPPLFGRGNGGEGRVERVAVMLGCTSTGLKAYAVKGSAGQPHTWITGLVFLSHRANAEPRAERDPPTYLNCIQASVNHSAALVFLITHCLSNTQRNLHSCNCQPHLHSRHGWPHSAHM
jgi:hypothetical protein